MKALAIFVFCLHMYPIWSKAVLNLGKFKSYVGPIEFGSFVLMLSMLLPFW